MLLLAGFGAYYLFNTSATPSPSTSTTSGRSQYFNGQTTFQLEVNRFWESNLPPAEAWVMVSMARAVSGFRQFNDDGSVFRRQTYMVGVMGMNPGDCGRCDIHSLQGNLDAAMTLYRKYGAERWSVYQQVKVLPVTVKVIKVPVREWTEVDETPTAVDCWWTYSRQMLGKDDKGRLFKIDPSEPVSFEASSVQFSMREEPAGEIIVRCR